MERRIRTIKHQIFFHSCTPAKFRSPNLEFWAAIPVYICLKEKSIVVFKNVRENLHADIFTLNYGNYINIMQILSTVMQSDDHKELRLLAWNLLCRNKPIFICIFNHFSPIKIKGISFDQISVLSICVPFLFLFTLLEFLSEVLPPEFFRYFHAVHVWHAKACMQLLWSDKRFLCFQILLP